MAEVSPVQASTVRWRPGQLEALIVGLALLVASQRWLAALVSGDAIAAWATIFVAVVVQALPFLVLGVLLSAAIAVLVPTSFFERALPTRPVLAVPAAAAAGIVLPGCECASVSVAGGLIARGVAPAAAVAFLLSSPAINPVVLVATAVAFPHDPYLVLARVAASLLAATVMGWLWLRIGRPEWLRTPCRADLTGLGKCGALVESVRHDLLHAGGFLVIGGVTAATLNVVVSRTVVLGLAHNEVVAVITMAALAFFLAICSEADAFVAASLQEFSMTSRLVFLVVGPMVDVKLVALQAGTFGRAFAVRFGPTTLVVATGCAVGVGSWLLR